jgi:hypothetical protein
MREVRQVEFEWGLWLHCPEQARTDYFFAGDLRERRSWVMRGEGGGGRGGGEETERQSGKETDKETEIDRSTDRQIDR